MKVLIQYAVTAIVDVQEDGMTAKVNVDHAKDTASFICIDPAKPTTRFDPQEANDYQAIALMYVMQGALKKAQERCEDIGEPTINQLEGKA